MAVDNVVMDERMALGFKGGPVFSTNKLVMVSGQERRMQNRSVAIHTYQWSFKNTSLQIEAALKAFWFDRRGDFKVWLLKDWSDFSGTAEPIELGTGSLADFQVVKTYTAGVNPYQRTIRHLKAGTLAVYVNGVLKATPGDYTVNSTGLVHFGAAPANGTVITATYEYYVPVRFNGDSYVSIVDYNPGMDIISVEDLRALEVIPWKNWDSSLLTMLGGTEVTRCFLAELTNPTGQLVRLTSHDVDMAIGAETYIKTPGFTLSRYTVKTGGEAATLDFVIPLSDDGPILIEDVRRGAWRGATIVVWIADTANPANRNIIAQGFVGRLDFTDRLDGKLELVTLADALKDVILVSVQPACPWKFCGRQCGAVEATWTRTGTVTTVTSRRKFTATITSPGSLNFTHGKVTWTSGDNAGAQGWVRQWNSSSGLVEMVTDFAFDIEAGNAFNILSGCRKNRTDCAAYNNINRYGGFDFVAR